MNAATKIEAVTLARAMADAFGEIESATKSAPGQVGQQKYKYADLTSVIEAIKPALIKHGLFFTQCPAPANGGVQLETILHHAGGESMSLGSLFVPANKNDAQAYGSALTYARRYALVTAFGVPVEDDDGNAATKSAPQQEHTPHQRVDEATLTHIIALCEAVGGNQPGIICKAYQIEALPDLTPSQATAVVNRLNEKLAERAKAESNKEAAHV